LDGVKGDVIEIGFLRTIVMEVGELILEKFFDVYKTMFLASAWHSLR